MAIFKVRYYETNHIECEIEASSKKEAENKMMEQIANGKVNVSFAELDDYGCHAVKIKENEKISKPI